MIVGDSIFTLLEKTFPARGFSGLDFFYVREDFSAYEGNLLKKEIGGLLWVDFCGDWGRSVLKRLFGVEKKFAFLTPVGFTYYLPAFIMYMLEERDYEFLQFCLFNISPLGGVDSFERIGEIYSCLNEEQIKVVKISLLAISEQWRKWGEEENDAKIALREYWDWV